MSRIGKLAIKLGEKVSVTADGGLVKFVGPKGKFDVVLPSTDIQVRVENGHINVVRGSEDRRIKSLHGLTRSILANAAKGVHSGWERSLAIRGVGFRCEVKGRSLQLALGFSHPVTFELPEGVTAEVGKAPRTEDSLPTLDLTLRSVDRELLGATAVKIRALRPPEPYKGKGIKYSEERIRRKEGKTGTA